VIAYGGFPGGDPRRFSPDPECSTEAQRQAHRIACQRWDAGYRDKYPGHAFVQRGDSFAHVARNPFGLGVYDDGAPECERCHDSGMVDSGEPSDADADATKWIPCPECEEGARA
jgi:hypothetical protein